MTPSQYEKDIQEAKASINARNMKFAIELNLVKENGMYFWGRAFVGTTKAVAIQTVMSMKAGN